MHLQFDPEANKPIISYSGREKGIAGKIGTSESLQGAQFSLVAIMNFALLRSLIDGLFQFSWRAKCVFSILQLNP